ncbi:hypothetical protein GMMP1_10028 [Candidatus Magnetomoraceae bacterium gMMP-1]
MDINEFQQNVADSIFKEKLVDTSIKDRIIRNCLLLGENDRFEIKKNCLLHTDKYLAIIIDDDAIPDSIKKKIKSIRFKPQSLIKDNDYLQFYRIKHNFSSIRKKIPTQEIRNYGIISTIRSLFIFEINVLRNINRMFKEIRFQSNEINKRYALDRGQYSDSVGVLVSSILKFEYFGSLKKRVELLLEIDSFDESHFFNQTIDSLMLVAQYILDYAVLDRSVEKFNQVLEELRLIEDFIFKCRANKSKEFKELLTELETRLNTFKLPIKNIINRIEVDILNNQIEIPVENRNVINSFESLKKIFFGELEVIKRVFILDRHFKII